MSSTDFPTDRLPDPITFESRIDLSGLRDAASRITGEIRKIIVGQDRMLELLLAAVLANGHVLIEGVPGIAKTLSARLLARTISTTFTRIQFTPDLMPSDILGTSVFDPRTTEFSFRRGPIFSNLVLIDEINRAPAKTQSALFEVMEERQVSADGHTYPLPPPFLVVATQNPLEHEGTYRLPEAQLDRFLFKIEVGYPGLEEEVAILSGHHAGRSPQHLEIVQQVLTAEEVAGYQATVSRVHVDESLMRYVAKITTRTRNHPAIQLGASPRASLAVMQGAKAMATIRGRDFITPEDVREVAGPALAHRLILTPEQEMEGRRATDVVTQIVDEVEVPR